MQIDLSSYRLFVFDADGTLRRCLIDGQPCPNKPGEWDLLPGVHDRLTDGTFDWRGRHIFAIASNQAGISLDYLTEPVALHMLIATAAAATDVYPRPRAIEFCPHLPSDGCECRKPAPGMLKALMEAFHASPDETIMIGDMESDRQAAHAAGVAFMEAWAFFGWDEPGNDQPKLEPVVDPTSMALESSDRVEAPPGQIYAFDGTGY